MTSYETSPTSAEEVKHSSENLPSTKQYEKSDNDLSAVSSGLLRPSLQSWDLTEEYLGGSGDASSALGGSCRTSEKSTVVAEIEPASRSSSLSASFESKLTCYVDHCGETVSEIETAVPSSWQSASLGSKWTGDVDHCESVLHDLCPDLGQRFKSKWQSLFALPSRILRRLLTSFGIKFHTLQNMGNTKHACRRGLPKASFNLPISNPSSFDSTLDKLSLELASTFSMIDKNEDGCLSDRELVSVLSTFGIELSAEDLDFLMRMLAANGDGEIKMNDFISNTIRVKENTSEETCLAEMEAAFHLFDIDKENCISAKGLYKVLTSLGEQTTKRECKRMINAVDRDGDGKVSLEDFQKMMS